MRLRYMIEYALRDRDTNPRYEPMGVWVQGPGPGLDIVMEYLPGNAEAQEEADWVINRLVENDIKSLPKDFLEYHRATMSPYHGMRGEIVETDDYISAEVCAASILQKISPKQNASNSFTTSHVSPVNIGEVVSRLTWTPRHRTGDTDGTLRHRP